MLKIYLYCGALPDAGGGEVRRAESLVWRRLLERAGCWQPISFPRYSVLLTRK